MPRQKLIIFLMSLVAIIIIGIAVYLFTNSSGLDITTGIVLITIAVICLFIIMGIIFVLLKSISQKR